MTLSTHKNMNIQKLTFGESESPLLVIDNFVDKPEQLIAHARQQQFTQTRVFYPGLSSDAPHEYKALFLNALQDTIIEVFQLPSTLRFSACQYSVVATPPKQLKLLQRIPHFDSLDKLGLAAVHYLFTDDLGGTSFYRHKKTGFEYIDESRRIEYLKSLEAENDGPDIPKVEDGYINGDTPLYQRIAEQDGIYNRLIIYRRNSLHSGSIDNKIFDSKLASGSRLTISSFIDCV